MFHVVVAKTAFNGSKIAKFQHAKTPFKAHNTFSAYKFNANEKTFRVKNQFRFFSSEEKKPGEEEKKNENPENKDDFNPEFEFEDPTLMEKRDIQIRQHLKSPAETIVESIEDSKNRFRKAEWEYKMGIKRKERKGKKAESEEEMVTEKLKKKKKAEEKRKSGDSVNYLFGEYKAPDIFSGHRTPDGKLLDETGNEIPLNPKTGLLKEINIPQELADETQKTGISAVAKRRMLTLDDERHERNLKELRLRALQVSNAMGMQGARYRLDSLPVEELKKVWNYVRKPDPDRPISTVVFNYNAGEIDDSYYKSGDSLIVYFRKTNFFRKHPEQKYLYLAGLFAIGVAIALAIAILDAFTLDHSDQEDKNKNYFRARLISSLGYTTAGAGATLAFTKLFTSYFLRSKRIDLVFTSFSALPLYCLFYLGTILNYPEDHALGKLAIATGLSASAGLGIAAHSLKKGTGFVRLLVPVLFSTTALSASLAISPFNFNLEYGVPLTVFSATLAGMFGASAIFPPYRSNTRAVFGSLFALTYAGLLLSYTQPYLNNIKFQEKYYGVDNYARDTNLLLKTFFFIPLKALDVFADQTSKRELFQ